MPHAFAANNLGVCYANGVSQKHGDMMTRAVECYELAAGQQLPEGVSFQWNES